MSNSPCLSNRAKHEDDSGPKDDVQLCAKMVQESKPLDMSGMDWKRFMATTLIREKRV
jgi:hypothetical protein